MRSKILVAVGLVAVAAIAVCFGLFSHGASAKASAELSRDIGAMFPEGLVTINYVSFEPVITRNQAISTAQSELRAYGVDPNTFPVDATVAAFSGEVQNPTIRATDNRQAWIVVIKQLPFAPSRPYNPKSQYVLTTSQLNLAIDATTGQILYEVLSGK